MLATAIGTCESLAQIVSAYRQGDISDEQAEYATRRTYALALMHFQMLSTLHEILDDEIENDSQPESQVDRARARAHGSVTPGMTPARRGK